MKRYKFSFVGYNKAGERIVEDIRSEVPDDVVCGMYLPCPGTSGKELEKKHGK